MQTATVDRANGTTTLPTGSSIRSSVAFLVHGYGPDDSRHIRTRDPEYAAAIAAALADTGYRVEIEEAGR